MKRRKPVRYKVKDFDGKIVTVRGKILVESYHGVLKAYKDTLATMKKQQKAITDLQADYQTAKQVNTGLHLTISELTEKIQQLEGELHSANWCLDRVDQITRDRVKEQYDAFKKAEET